MSDLRVASIAGADGTSPATLVKQSAAKAWINWENVGAASIGDSFNISSFTDTGTGSGSGNLTNSFSNSEYSCGSSGYRPGAGFAIVSAFPGTVSVIYLNTANVSGSFQDIAEAAASALGDLA